jgi:hypothetical protein
MKATCRMRGHSISVAERYWVQKNCRDDRENAGDLASFAFVSFESASMFIVPKIQWRLSLLSRSFESLLFAICWGRLSLLNSKWHASHSFRCLGFQRGHAHKFGQSPGRCGSGPRLTFPVPAFRSLGWIAEHAGARWWRLLQHLVTKGGRNVCYREEFLCSLTSLNSIL